MPKPGNWRIAEPSSLWMIELRITAPLVLSMPVAKLPLPSITERLITVPGLLHMATISLTPAPAAAEACTLVRSEPPSIEIGVTKSSAVVLSTLMSSSATLMSGSPPSWTTQGTMQFGPPPCRR